MQTIDEMIEKNFTIFATRLVKDSMENMKLGKRLVTNFKVIIYEIILNLKKIFFRWQPVHWIYT